MIKIFLRPVSDENHRTWVQLYQGLRKHPSVELVDNPSEADFYFIHWYGGVLNDLDPSKVVYFDFNDEQRLNIPEGVEVHTYFKRSMVSPYNSNGTRSRITYPDFVTPINHACVMDEFKSEYIPHENRHYDIITTFRGGHATNRLRVGLQDYLKDKYRNTNLNTHFGITPNNGYSNHYDSEYHNLLRNSKIIVTMNPCLWEGDNRLYESMSSGALVFCDELFMDVPFKFRDKVHLLYYKVSEIDKLPEKINYYLRNKTEREGISKSGYDFTMENHTSKSRIDYILNKITNER